MALRDLGRLKEDAERDGRTQRAYSQQLRDFPLLDGQLFSVTVKAGESVGIAGHSLGRWYQGGLCCSEDGGGFAEGATVVAPETAQAFRYCDPGKQFAVSCRRNVLVDKTFVFFLF